MNTESDGRLVCVWEYRQIRVEQTIDMIAGEVSRRMDTIRVDYKLENTGAESRQVGLRAMLDTYIGANDGVPFIVPGLHGIVQSPKVFSASDVPDFVRALEKPSLTNPGAIVDVGLRPSKTERPSKVVLTHWPGADAQWNYDTQGAFGRDSAVGIYYDPAPLGAGAIRVASFTYGLGTISSTKTQNARLSLTAGGPFHAGEKFWVTALVQNPKGGQRVRVELPDGLTLSKSEESVKSVPAGGDYTQISWLVEIAPTTFGSVDLCAVLEPESVQERQTISVQPRNARLTLTAKGPFQAGRPFWVVAMVQHPKPRQSVQLSLPAGLKLHKGEVASKPVPTGDDFGRVMWAVQIAQGIAGKCDVAATLKPDSVEEHFAVDVEAGNLVR
jgi:hypothetical protein